MSVIFAAPVNADGIEIEVSIRAKLVEWKNLRKLIEDQRAAGNPLTSDDGMGGTTEPFWSLIHRLGDVIKAVEKQHTNYP